MNTITINPLGRIVRPPRRHHDRVVILRSLDLTHRYSPFARRRRVDVRHHIASVLRRMLRAAFSDVAALIVTIAMMTVAAYHSIVIPDALEVQAAVGMDALALLPWAIVYAVRHTSDRPADEKGGTR